MSMLSTLTSPAFVFGAAAVTGLMAYHVSTADDITFGLLKNVIPRTDIPTSATQPCPPGSINCVRATWTAPKTMSYTQAVTDVQAAFDAYPQTGLEGKIDKGGWKIVTGSWKSGALRLEFSSGKGFFARLLNGGEPFIDDVLVEVVKGSKPVVAEIRSSSRLGKGDLGVNPKRVNYIAKSVRNKGWDTTKAQYPHKTKES